MAEPMTQQEATLEAVAKTLPLLTGETFEAQLLAFDMLANLGGLQSAASILLRDAAFSTDDGAMRERLQQASQLMARRVPCAVTPAGLTWKQAGNPDHAVSEMPQLGVWDLVPGMTIRVVQTFHDYGGKPVEAGEILHFKSLDYFAKEEGYTLEFQEKTIPLCDGMPGDSDVLLNFGNAFLEPVADLESVKRALAYVEKAWTRLPREQRGRLKRAGIEIDQCSHWIASDRKTPPPVCLSGPAAIVAFPKSSVPDSDGDHLGFQIAFLFAAVKILPTSEH
jgi:Domain of unknown function (DUF3601)